MSRTRLVRRPAAAVPGADSVPEHVVRWRKLGAVLAVLLGAVLLLTTFLAAPAGAHARLIDSTPGDDELVDAAPEEVELVFDEGVEITDDSVRVVGPDGEDVHDGATAVDDDGTTVTAALRDGTDQEGTYTIDWRVTSYDSHVITGTLLFHVGERTGAADLGDEDDRLVEIVGFHGRWLALLGSVVALGAAALAVAASGEAAARPRWRRLVVGGAVASLVGVTLALVSRVAEIRGESLIDASGSLPGSVTDARSSEMLAWRFVPLLLTGGLALVTPVWRRAPWAVLTAAGAGVVVAALGGHAWTADSRVLAVGSDAVHYGVVSIWAGGLLALLVALPGAEDTRRLAGRFSTLALGAAVAAAVTGSLLGWQHLGALGELTSTSYGRYILAKGLFFALLIGLGWMNRYRLVPLVERTVQPLSRSLRVELILVVLVLGVTAGLINTPPGVTDEEDRGGEPFSDRVEGDASATSDPDLVVELEMDVVPAQVGDNEFHLYFYDADGAPLSVLVAQARISGEGSSPRTVDLDIFGGGHAYGSGVSMPLPGNWTVEVRAIPEGLAEPVVFTFEVPIT